MWLHWIHLLLVRSNISQLIGFVLKELIYLFLVFDNALGDDLTVLGWQIAVGQLTLI